MQEIIFNKKGKVIKGEDAGQYISIRDDTNGKTGGYYFYISSSNFDNKAPVYDTWVENYEILMDFFKNNIVKWLDNNCDTLIAELNTNKYFIGIIDGKKVKTIKSFLIEIAKTFKFPSYYGVNMNAFYECINDLDWIEEKKYALVIDNSSEFLKDEDTKVKEDILDTLQQVRREWANVPNYEGEDQYRTKSDFIIVLK